MHPIVNTENIVGIIKAIYNKNEYGELSIDFESNALSPLNKLLSIPKKLTRTNLKIIKRYLFLESFNRNTVGSDLKTADDFKTRIPVSCVVEELKTGVDLTYYEYLKNYAAYAVHKYTQYTFNDFMTMPFNETEKIIESCKLLIKNEEQLTGEAQLMGEEEDEAHV